MNKTGIIILAAGNSSRLGQPKQLLPFRGKTMLLYVITEALAASLHPVVVVTGAHYDEIYPALAGPTITIVYNPGWETGMASGILAGLDKILSIQPHLRSVIVAVCDQPFISAELFQALVDKWSVSGKGLIACQYADTIGTPVLFDHRHFKELSMLSGDAGAKQLLKRYPAEVTTVPFLKGDIDIDTEEDFQHLTGSNNI